MDPIGSSFTFVGTQEDEFSKMMALNYHHSTKHILLFFNFLVGHQHEDEATDPVVGLL